MYSSSRTQAGLARARALLANCSSRTSGVRSRLAGGRQRASTMRVDSVVVSSSIRVRDEKLEALLPWNADLEPTYNRSSGSTAKGARSPCRDESARRHEGQDALQVELHHRSSLRIESYSSASPLLTLGERRWPRIRSGRHRRTSQQPRIATVNSSQTPIKMITPKGVPTV